MLSQVPPLGFKGVFFSAPCAALITGLLCLIAAKGRKCVQEVILIPPLYPLLPHNSFASPYSVPLLCSPPPFPFLMNCGTLHRQQTAAPWQIKDGAEGGSVIGKGLRCWLPMYEKTLPLDLSACNKCHYSSFWMLLKHRRWGVGGSDGK